MHKVHKSEKLPLDQSEVESRQVLELRAKRPGHASMSLETLVIVGIILYLTYQVCELIGG